MSKTKSKIFQEVPEEQRAQIISDNAASVKENYSIVHEFSKDEMTELRENYIEDSIELAEIEQELAIIKAEFKAKMAPVQGKMRTTMDKIKTKSETIKGTAYFMPDYVENEMYIYDGLGNLLDQRKLRNDEKQSNIFSLKQNNS